MADPAPPTLAQQLAWVVDARRDALGSMLRATRRDCPAAAKRHEHAVACAEAVAALLRREMEQCPACEGTGDSSPYGACSVCRGTGKARPAGGERGAG